MGTLLSEVREQNKLTDAFGMASDIITKEYLCNLSKYEVKDLARALKRKDISDYTRLYKVSKLVADKKENMLDKLVTVLNAAYTCNATVITIINGCGDHTDYYLGVVSKDVEQQEHDIATQGEVFRSTLLGNFDFVKFT